ncbi:MAG TPA: glycosyltransferase family 2 protein [Candidatus Sulfotelmatobacter sp.]|nr:glycosyltransferase family 2 protein [Candidatus Sulfotelmatobacter sp.]
MPNMKDATTTVSILLVCYNARNFLEDCLNSIREKVTVPYEVILLDNGSSDDTAGFIAQRFPWVRLVRSEENLGFIRGNNLAAQQAQGKYYLLLNSDTILLGDIAPAVRLLESLFGIGIVGGEMYGAHRQLRPSAGRFPRAWYLWRFASLWVEARRMPHFGAPEWHAFQVDWVEGSFLMTSAENWQAVGGLDESNFFYGDDIDFCRSTRQRGLATVQCSEIQYVHFGGFEPSRTGYIYAGFRHYHQKFSSNFERLLADAILRFGLLVRIVLYGLRYRITGDAILGDRFRHFLKVHSSWARTATAAPRFP